MALVQNLHIDNKIKINKPIVAPQQTASIIKSVILFTSLSRPEYVKFSPQWGTRSPSESNGSKNRWFMFTGFPEVFG